MVVEDKRRGRRGRMIRSSTSRRSGIKSSRRVRSRIRSSNSRRRSKSRGRGRGRRMEVGWFGGRI